jgi:hypothetical protein
MTEGDVATWTAAIPARQLEAGALGPQQPPRTHA